MICCYAGFSIRELFDGLLKTRKRIGICHLVSTPQSHSLPHRLKFQTPNPLPSGKVETRPDPNPYYTLNAYLDAASHKSSLLLSGSLHTIKFVLGLMPRKLLHNYFEFRDSFLIIPSALYGYFDANM